MKQVHLTTQYKKDFKKYKNDRVKVAKLFEIVSLLEHEKPLPRSCNAHKLIGNYAGCWECHVGPDFLLIWVDEEEKIVHLVRLGSHSELF